MFMPPRSVAEIEAVERFFNDHREEVLETDRRIRARNAARKNPPEVEEILRRGREQIRARIASIQKQKATASMLTGVLAAALNRRTATWRLVPFPVAKW